MRGQFQAESAPVQSHRSVWHSEVFSRSDDVLSFSALLIAKSTQIGLYQSKRSRCNLMRKLARDSRINREPMHWRRALAAGPFQSQNPTRLATEQRHLSLEQMHAGFGQNPFIAHCTAPRGAPGVPPRRALYSSQGSSAARDTCQQVGCAG